MIDNKYSHTELTGKIIGCAMEVHNNLHNGFQEVIYQRALAMEMELNNLVFAREVEMDVYYKKRILGTRRVDFLVAEKVSVEIKALIKLEPVHLAQAINYIECFDLKVGLLLNFGAIRLEFHRVLNNRLK